MVSTAVASIRIAGSPFRLTSYVKLYSDIHTNQLCRLPAPNYIATNSVKQCPVAGKYILLKTLQVINSRRKTWIKKIKIRKKPKELRSCRWPSCIKLTCKIPPTFSYTKCTHEKKWKNKNNNNYFIQHLSSVVVLLYWQFPYIYVFYIYILCCWSMHLNPMPVARHFELTYIICK